MTEFVDKLKVPFSATQKYAWRHSEKVYTARTNHTSRSIMRRRHISPDPRLAGTPVRSAMAAVWSSPLLAVPPHPRPIRHPLPQWRASGKGGKKKKRGTNAQGLPGSKEVRCTRSHHAWRGHCGRKTEDLREIVGQRFTNWGSRSHFFSWKQTWSKDWLGPGFKLCFRTVRRTCYPFIQHAAVF